MKLKTLFVILALINLSVVAQNKKTQTVQLFDGKSLQGWKQLGGKAEYRIEGDAIVGITVPNTPNSFLVTEQEYGDFILELEVRIVDTTSNSGIQFRSHHDPSANNGAGRVYGYQFELDPSSRRWTGGLYDEGRRDWLYPMMLNSSGQPAYKHGEYNLLKLECIGNEIKTWVNGFPAAYIVDTVDRQGFIALQVHSIGNNAALAGKKIYWKNIKLTTGAIKPASFSKAVYVRSFIPNYLTDFEKKAGWKLLFDGNTSKGWVGAYKAIFPLKGWEIRKGELTVLPSSGGEAANGGDIVTTEQYSFFDFSFEFKLTPGANSGVKYFVTLSEGNTGSAIGLEYQLLDDSLHEDAKAGLNGNRTLASLYDLIKAKKEKRFIHQPGEWNSGRIVVYPDNHVEHYLNGIKVLEYERGSKEYRDLVAISKYKGWSNFGEAKQGRILIQDHGNWVNFRSIKIRKL